MKFKTISDKHFPKDTALDQAEEQKKHRLTHTTPLKLQEARHQPCETDERYKTVDQAIRDALFLLARQKDPCKITVTELCKKAGIVRSAFYNHYEDMPSLILSVQNRSVDEIFQMIKQFQSRGDHAFTFAFYLSLCRYIADNSLLQQFLHWPEQSEQFIKHILSSFYDYALHRDGNIVSTADNSPRLAQGQTSYAVSYAVGGAAGILHHWILEGQTIPPESMAEILTNLFECGPYATLHSVSAHKNTT